MTDVLRIPIEVDLLREVLGVEPVDYALRFGAEKAAGRALLNADLITESVAAGFLSSDVANRLRVADVYSRRLEIAVGLMGRDVRNQYEAAIGGLS